MSSLFKAIFSILITIWKLNNLRTFLRDDVKSDRIPEWCRAKRLYYCFPLFLIPVWFVNLILSISIAIFFIQRHHGEGFVKVPGSNHELHMHNKYLYTKYIAHSGIYLNWPDGHYENSYMKLSEIDYIMANSKTTVHLAFKLPYVCFEKSLSDRTPSQCFKYNNNTKLLSKVSTNEYRLSNQNSKEQNTTFIFHYRSPSNQYNLGQIFYNGHITPGTLFLNKLLYFRLNDNYLQNNNTDFLYQNSTKDTYQFYQVNQQLIPIEKAWRHGRGKCRPCILGPQLSKH